MKEEILVSLKAPGTLERLYQTKKDIFKQEFNELYPELKGDIVADFWYERLNYEKSEINWGSGKEFLFILIASLFAGIIAKFPAFSSLSEDFFYPRNVGFILFPPLVAYFGWKNKLSTGKIAFLSVAVLTGLIFINSLPNAGESDTLILACIHLLLFLWFLLGFTYTGGLQNKVNKRLDFLKYNGDILVISALLVIAGGIMTGITLGLFSGLGLDIEEFYFENIVVFALPAVPVFGTYLIQKNPQLVGWISPVIARIFSPLALVMLVIYLSAMFYTGRDVYNDRDFLLIFNLLLIGVLAIVFFSVAESSGTSKSRFEIRVLFLLCVLTVIINCIALSAIVWRISEWGISPNRAAVLGANILILINLLMVTRQLFRAVIKKIKLFEVGRNIALYLPVYFLWAVIVTFLFPLIFGME